MSFISTTNLLLFAVVENGKVTDGWLAESLEEAQADNKGKQVFQLTEVGEFVTIGEVWKG